MLIYLVFTTLLVFSDASSKPKHDPVFSDEDHYGNDGEHEHNSQYDHDAFLGKDEASTYSDLSPEESKEKLGTIFHKLDADNNGYVTEDELYKWMLNAQNRYALVDAEENMKQHDTNGDGNVTWDEYKNDTYGFLDTDGVPKDSIDADKYPKYNRDENTKEHYAKQLSRDERKFNVADTNGDKSLNKEELAAFMHPETHDHMRVITALETIEDMDKDNDNLISLDEYLADAFPEEHTNGEEPEWLQDERKNFTEVHDKNKDGKLDTTEVTEWIFPADEDYLLSEAKHLMSESDEDHDGKVSKEEMLDKADLYVGSQAAEMGELLKDEL